jgi:hypothetical protein
VKPVFILASSDGEARRIATLAGFRSELDWLPLSDRNTRGTRGNVVLSTGPDCWRSRRTGQAVADVRDILGICDLKVIPVPCPDMWDAMGFQLPPGWNVPKAYGPKVILHPRSESPLGLWARVRKALSRN